MTMVVYMRANGKTIDAMDVATKCSPTSLSILGSI
jgi:hypothetical protein